MNFGDQSAREDSRQLVDEIMVENRRLRQRLYQVESKLQEGDVRFSTPESQKEAADPQRQEAGGPRREEAADPQRQEAGGSRREEAADPQSQEAGSFRGKEAEDPPKERSPKSGEDTAQQPNTAFTEKSIEFMKLMMDSMREMQKRMTESKEESGMIRGVEVIRSGSPDLPALAPWEPQHGPLILGDWMLLAEPIISDLSMSASEWWKTVVRLAEEWYKVHMTLNPIERIQHPATVPVEVSQDKWQRVERRVSSMMLQAVPPPVRDELVSARRMSTFGILTHLMVTYSPGGVTEKQNILRSLEDPPEIQKISEGPTALRRWLRWRARAREIGAVAPDPALQLKGLLRMTKRVLDNNRELQFRVSLVRSGLGVDTTPTEVNVEQLANHLLAELDQLSMTDKRPGQGSAAPQGEQPKIKSLELEKADKGKGKGKEKTGEEEKGKMKCRFYNSEGGCKKGKECEWLHESRDDRRRCWTCGAVDHMSPACSRPKGSGGGSPQNYNKQKLMKSEAEEKSGGQKESSDTQSVSSESSIKELLEEVGKMLKSVAGEGSATSSTSTHQEMETNVKISWIVVNNN
jgi:hypothetical protein